MDAEPRIDRTASIEGHMIHLNAGHAVALYARHGEDWVAEFRDGRGEISYAGAWFRSYSGGLRYCHNHRTAVPFSTPLSPAMLEELERLHRESEARQEKILAIARVVAATAQRYATNAMLRLRGCQSKMSGTLV